MKILRFLGSLLVGALLLPLGAASASPASAPAALNSGSLYTTYALADGGALSWTTCGSALEASGCFGSGTLTGFDRPCAVLESAPALNGSTIGSYLYVLDSGGVEVPAVTLKIFQKLSIVGTTSATTTLTLQNTLQLPLQFGAKVECFMSANATEIAAATSLNGGPAYIALSNFAVTGGGYRGTITGMSADEAGNILVMSGGEEAFDASFVPNSINGFIFP